MRRLLKWDASTKRFQPLRRPPLPPVYSPTDASLRIMPAGGAGTSRSNRATAARAYYHLGLRKRWEVVRLARRGQLLDNLEDRAIVSRWAEAGGPLAWRLKAFNILVPTLVGVVLGIGADPITLLILVVVGACVGIGLAALAQRANAKFAGMILAIPTS